MSFTISDFLKLDLSKEAELLSGLDGLNNEIVWVNVMEILDQINSIQKGELLVTTGYSLDDEKINKDLILKLKTRGVAGIAIQPGYYIEDIPDNIINDGAKLGFPVIKLPMKLTFSHITRTILRKIHYSCYIHKNNNSSENEILFNIIKNKYLSRDDTDLLSTKLDTSINKTFILMILSISHFENGFVNKEDIEKTIEKILDYLEFNNGRVIVQELITEVLFLFSNDSDNDFNIIIDKLNEIISTSSNEFTNICFRLAVSSPFYELENLFKAYNEAILNIEAMEKASVKRAITYYENLPLLQLLASSNTKENYIKFTQNILKELYDYDKLHKTNYIVTLKTLLNHNCNMNIAAEKLYIHRHTLRYRLEKIKEICGIDIYNFNNRFKFQMALLLDDLYI